MNKHQVTDEEVQNHIEYLKKMAGSDNLHDMLKKDLQHRANAFYWYGRIRKLVFWPVFVYAVIAAGLISALCFYFFVVSTLPAVYSALIGGGAMVVSALCFAALNKVG